MKKGIKAFTPYVIDEAFYTWCGKAAKSSKTADVIESFLSQPPAAHEWGRYGLVAPMEANRYVHDLDGAARLLCFQFSERILPASVRDKELNKRLAELREKTDRDATKQEYAQIRDEVEAALLPKAFVRDTLVPVLVYKDRIVFCTTSARRIEMMIAHLTRLMQARNVECSIRDVGGEAVVSIPFFLGETARDGWYEFDDCDFRFDCDSTGVFKHEQKATIRVKDRDVSCAEIQKVIDTEGYRVAELGMTLFDAGEEHAVASFVLTEKWVVKALKLIDKDEMKTAEDAHATYWMYAMSIYSVVKWIERALQEKIDEHDNEL